jgi:hypothetical protein
MRHIRQKYEYFLLVAMLTISIFTFFYVELGFSNSKNTLLGDSSKALKELEQGKEPDNIPDYKEGAEYFPEESDVWCKNIEDESTKSTCWKAFQAGLSYYNDGLAQRLKGFKWQHLTTQLIFFVVNALVIIGIYFSWVQFKKDLEMAKERKGSDEKEHHIELSTSGIKVSSSVLGVIILVISLAFFYLYLVYVYPIKETF